MPLLESVLSIKVVTELTTLATNTAFDVQSDAFETLREIMLLDNDHAKREAFMQTNFATILELITKISADPNYFARRKALALLNDCLRKYPACKKEYINDKDNLKKMMNHLLDINKEI